MSEAVTRRMNVIDAKPITSGTDDKGRAWTLYDVTAVTPEGAPIEEKLKSFARLNGDVEVTVERQEHEKYGVSYLLKPAEKAGARLGPKVDELRDRLDGTDQKVANLVTRVNGLEALVKQLIEERGGIPVAATGSRFGDDHPF